MKNLKITFCLMFLTFTSMYSQENESHFLLSPDVVKIYDYETSTKGTNFEYQFEDDYTIKLTTKVYKIKLFFEAVDITAVQKAVSKILDGKDVTSGFETMVWEKTSESGKPMYTIELKDDKLRIDVFRKQMNTQAYALLNSLGQKFIKEINSKEQKS